MRPHKLIMKAFGPFAKETTVDFDAMGNSIYLISGDTGSGKTTIFDGIIYALYGTASGGARSGLGTEAFHSDYAKDGRFREEMRVEFTFSNAGRTYTVSRRVYWGKSGESKTPAKESVLTENGNTLVSGKGKEDRDDVTAKVTEILGLDADQFRRIIMLAQGEFQKFLVAGSDERGAVLGKLFDNRRHQDLQLRLKAADALLKKKDDDLAGEAKARIRVFVIPDEIEEEERCMIAADHPDLLIAARKIIDRMDKELLTLNGSVSEKEKLLKKLEEQKTRAETQNRLLDDLDSGKEKLERLEEQKGQIEALKKQVGRSEAAEKILPSENALNQAQHQWTGILERIRRLEEERDQLAKQAEALKESLKTAEEKNTPQIGKLQKEQAAVQNILHFYDDLAESRRILELKHGELASAKENAEQAHKELLRMQERQRELEQKLLRLSSAGESAVSAADQTQIDLNRRKEDLLKIQSSIETVKSLKKEAAELAEALAKERQAEVDAEEEHLRLNKAFIQGQAGILAQDLRDQLKKERVAICPVCGAEHTAADAASFAECLDSIPTREEVDKAYGEWELARQNSQKALENHSEKENSFRQEKEMLLERSRTLIGISDYEELIRGTKLSDAAAQCEEQRKTAQIAYDQAVRDKTAKEKALADKTAADETAAALNKAWMSAAEKQGTAQTAFEKAKTSVENWEIQLKDHPKSKEDAQARIDRLEEEAETLREEILKRKNDYEQCLRDQAANEGSLAGAGAERENRLAVKLQTEKDLADQLAKGAFADADAYHQALSPEGELFDAQALSEWLLVKKEEIDGYEQKYREVFAAVRQLTESTKNMERRDLAALTEQIREVSRQTEELKKQQNVLSSRIRTNRIVLSELTAISGQRGKYRRAAAELNPLANAANGSYAFSRYVLGDFFHRIVEHANLHLETMTDGEYCLVPKETGDGRKNLGLGLKIRNTITGQERETATLSGGQLFESSLSLALGLSDVVQMESTSRIRIDSMFIDEGFGSLDGRKLDKAIEVLQHLSAGKRQIGIISHIDRLEECLPKKICVVTLERGSTVRIETDA